VSPVNEWIVKELRIKTSKRHIWAAQPTQQLEHQEHQHLQEQEHQPTSRPSKTLDRTQTVAKIRDPRIPGLLYCYDDVDSWMDGSDTTWVHHRCGCCCCFVLQPRLLPLLLWSTPTRAPVPVPKWDGSITIPSYDEDRDQSIQLCAASQRCERVIRLLIAFKLVRYSR